VPKRRGASSSIAPPRRVGPPGLIELDRFTESTLKQWKTYSQDLDELQQTLFFGVRPEQQRLQQEILSALGETAPIHVELDGWCRIVPYRYSLEPLSCAGSLQGVGGRFNAGIDLDPDTLAPWPALYLAADYETAFREKFQLARDARVDGLTPEELALEHVSSHATMVLRGRLYRVFDMTTVEALAPVAKVLRRIKIPPRARQLDVKLKTGARMIRTSQELHDAVCIHNWRTLPIQFGLPAASHVLAGWIRSAGFEATQYRSTKGAGNCVALFPGLIGANSFVELRDPAPESVQHTRLDSDTADLLSGWESVPRQFWPR
jgi:hypothetical protein